MPFITKLITGIFPLLLALLLHSCQDPETLDSIDVGQEIRALRSTTDKWAYLEEIFLSDQAIRGRSAGILLKNGEGSNEGKAFRIKMDPIDRLNQKRIRSYLEKFGYPDKDSISATAALAPWVVIHHSDFAERKRNFAYLHQAYIEKTIEPGQFALYLERTYQIKYGHRPKMKDPYKQEDQIKHLLTELDLTEEAAALEH